MEILRSAIAGFLTYLVTLVDLNSAQYPFHEIIRPLVESTPEGTPLLQVVNNHVPVNSGHVGLGWHPPSPSEINNLTATINATGVYGFVFNSSVTPASLPYGTYNWCNMPHVRPQEYSIPPKEYKLEYVEVVSAPCPPTLPQIIPPSLPPSPIPNFCLSTNLSSPDPPSSQENTVCYQRLSSRNTSLVV